MLRKHWLTFAACMTALMLLLVVPFAWHALKHPNSPSSLRARYCFGLESMLDAIGLDSLGQYPRRLGYRFDEVKIIFQANTDYHLELIFKNARGIQKDRISVVRARTSSSDGPGTWSMVCHRPELAYCKRTIQLGGGSIVSVEK